MTVSNTPQQPDFSGVRREVPDWFLDAKLGIFIHWGAYSVPAWAPPTGELGAVDPAEYFENNPYAEWYGNTMRIVGSPTARHHAEVYGDAPYDDFLDAWHAESFDAADLMELCERAGAAYVIPTTKHHDGIALWDAPGTGTRNTVHRGPRRDLVGEIADAARARGLRFGTYYSGGLDWSFEPLPPITTEAEVQSIRPVSEEYARYAFEHASDLIRRYAPDVLWDDINWPDAGKPSGQFGLPELFRLYRDAVPDGVLNDRWGVGFHDFTTSEYQAGLENETGPAWERCRGIGFSFGYNQRDGVAESLDGPRLVRLFVDIVSRGGNLLLNVGPRADGTIPELQRVALEALGEWMLQGRAAIHGSRPLASDHNSDAPWVRWTATKDSVWAIVDGTGEVTFGPLPAEVDGDTAFLGDIALPAVRSASGELVVTLPETASDYPRVIRFARKADSGH